MLAYDPFHLEGQSIKNDKLHFNNSMLTCFKEGVHLESDRQILDILLALKIFLHDDIISIITTFMLELYTDQENYIYAGEL